DPGIGDQSALQPAGRSHRPPNPGGAVTGRRGALLLAVLLPLLALVGLASPAAQAHPLGNATVNHYDGLHLYPTRVLDSAVEDIAEIPTLQRKSLIDTDHDGRLSEAEQAAYAGRQCAAMARA